MANVRTGEVSRPLLHQALAERCTLVPIGEIETLGEWAGWCDRAYELTAHHLQNAETVDGDAIMRLLSNLPVLADMLRRVGVAI